MTDKTKTPAQIYLDQTNKPKKPNPTAKAIAFAEMLGQATKKANSLDLNEPKVELPE